MKPHNEAACKLAIRLWDNAHSPTPDARIGTARRIVVSRETIREKARRVFRECSEVFVTIAR
jgi:hypothetical protein